MIDQVFGIIFVQDFNVHSIRWLKYSSHEPPEGLALQEFCQNFSLMECVQNPTRGNHLLDLVLSDIVDPSHISILPPISDHNMILIQIDKYFDVISSEMRQVFDYKFANWKALTKFIRNANWDIKMYQNPHEAATYFHEKVKYAISFDLFHLV